MDIVNYSYAYENVYSFKLYYNWIIVFLYLYIELL